ncbi:hypothetical protein A2348_05010 [Candidatus Uhrbacteria bacterium RIFOXYB12_FULL_58_10]|uniref:Uncharacterized protein n=1 Tax=Candidatus Uhrbacteria bacterium RIFOXYB2_FULL_57_15 TaxID=1802422 RepID=A0A1F7W8W6_9BACT|nr:MAG: hypothetical protein A2348_05010 [Candidatus Uhrbacteria bacterium RIFOXYB12_FULL_58_10]OGL98828.1 MAG: hypothetical protein A2304_05030 [Candidatus Uhrbacteria bacterium RIFOXYB2_FULL_57_15]OGM00297.1 MAG: hypothetical protein A2501_02070 [Candidatus Uhrbacteria bacterium RIFOXYC12_FULL_57_11]
MDAETLHGAGEPFCFSWVIDGLAYDAWDATRLAPVVNAVRLHGHAQIFCNNQMNGHDKRAVQFVMEMLKLVALPGETFQVMRTGDDWQNFSILVTRTKSDSAF